jgi:hypothetical protein
LSFSSMICLFLISRSKSLKRMLVIYVLYFSTYWNILLVLLCSSNSISNLYTNPSVWDLGVCPLELVYEDPKLLCEVQISPKMFVPVVELGLEGNILS